MAFIIILKKINIFNTYVAYAYYDINKVLNTRTPGRLKKVYLKRKKEDVLYRRPKHKQNPAEWQEPYNNYFNRKDT